MKLRRVFQIRFLRKVNKINIDKDTQFTTLMMITGALSGLFAVFFHTAIVELASLIGTNKAFTLKTVGLGAICTFISGYLTTRVSPWTSGSGIPQIKLDLVVNHGVIKLKDMFIKIITSILALASGFSLGREGPTVAITAAIGSNLGRFFNLSKSQIKSLLAVGSAAGIAAAFNTPIAAVIFTLEEVVGNLNTKMLGPIVISSVIAAVTAAALQGNHPLFHTLQYSLTDNRELFFYLLVGILCALFGVLFINSVLMARTAERKIFKNHKLTVMMLCFFLIAAASHFNIDVIHSGQNTIIESLLSHLTSWKTITLLLILKFILTSLSYSTGISGGLFLPTLFMGAMIGALVGNLAAFVLPDVVLSNGSYALVGMGAFLAAVIRAPFTSIIMVFEMTHDYNIVLPLMIANIVSYLLSNRLVPGSIYERISKQDGIHLPSHEDNELLDSLLIESAMIRDVQTLNYNLTVEEAIKIVNHSEISGYPIMKNGLIYGILSSSELGNAFVKFRKMQNLEHVCKKEIIHVYPDQSLMIAFHKLKENKISRLLVVSRINDKKLIGIITAEDIVDKFGFHILEDSKANVIDKLISEEIKSK
ncbi:MAG: CIC family chloride channel protein [Thermoproteota archaeon]|jgi:CIC family chloride channel protein